MVLTLAIPISKFYHLEDLITIRHHRQHGQGDAGDGTDCGVRLLHRSIHVVVFGEPLGILHDVEPDVRADGVVVLGADHLQHRAAAD